MGSNVIPSDSPSVFAALSTSQATALAYPSPFPPGFAGLVFDWIGEERLELRSEITDSWVEDNTTVQDQIALHPERFTLDAATAEVVFSPTSINASPSQPLNPLSLNTSMVPTLTAGASAALAGQAINGLVPGVIPASLSPLTSPLAGQAATSIANTSLANGVSALPSTLGPALTPPLGSVGAQNSGGALGQAPNSTDTAIGATPSGLYGYYAGLQGGALDRQSTVMGFIYQMWKGRQLFTVETPWGIFTSMAIELADGVQPEETKGRTDHKITFKKFRIAGESLLAPALGRASNQAADASPAVNGNIGQQDATDQQVNQIFNGWFGGQGPLAVPNLVP